MTAHRQSLAVARAWAECGGLRRGRPLPGGQPVLPQLRLQGGHPGLPGQRRDAGAAGGVRRRARPCALVEAERITVLPGRADDLPDDPGPPGPRPTSTCPACGWRSPARRPSRSPWSSGCSAELSFETVLTAYGLTEAVVATMCRPGDDPETVAAHLRAGPIGRRSRCAIGRDRRDPAARAERDARLPRRPGGDRAPRSTPTAGCTPATSAASTRTAT